MMFELFQKGGPMMWPLLVMSFFSLTFILERLLFFWNESRRRSPRHLRVMIRCLETGRIQRAKRVAKRAPHDFVIRTLLHGIDHRHISLTQALESQALVELRRKKKYLTFLDTVITAAPLLGILGTVLGIILSFDVLGNQGVSDPMAVTTGISQALITTAFGLAVALMTLLPYNFFQSLYQRSVEELEKYSTILELIVQKSPQILHATTSSAQITGQDVEFSNSVKEVSS